MNIRSFQSFILFALATSVISLTGCVKENFDAPPVTNTDPVGLKANYTIKQIKDIFYPNYIAATTPLPVQIPDTADIIISGVINTDDKSGNFYKVLSLQDSTGGIQIVVDASSLYNEYPVGRRIFVRCRGMYIYNYQGTLELGSYIDYKGAQPSLGGVPSANIPHYIVKGMTGVPVPVRTFTAFDLLTNPNSRYDQSTLIKLTGVQFVEADTNKTYADAINKAYGNLKLQDCSNYQVTLRTSGYADFATTKVQTGKGDVYGIYTVYGTTSQLAIRNLNDIQLTGSRCP